MKNVAKHKLLQGQPTFGTWLSLGHPHSSRLLARMGFDWLTVDVEHAPFDWREISNLLALIAEAGCAPLVRVPEGSHAWIKRALDAGAYGVVVPMVDTVEQARAAIAAARYPPLGTRSAGGGMHNLNFDCSLDEYYATANQEVLVVLQTESPEGVRNAREIYALPGCDAVFVGPVDLKFQMRAPDGEFPAAAAHEAQIEQVMRAGREAGTPTGMHVFSVQEARRRVEQGMQLLAISSDLGLLSQAAEQIVSGLGLGASRDLAKY